jgi:D-amino-acid dehydrogenase
MTTVAVVGAGISGLSVAYECAKAGYEVSVFDEESYPAMKTSYANGGQISVSNSEVWNSWSNVLKGMKWLTKKDAPLLIRPSLDWDKAVWIAKFLYATANGEAARNTAQTILLGIESRKRYAEIIRDENIEFDKSDCGILHFYKDEQYLQHAVDMKKIYNENGCEWDILNRDQILEIEPTLDRASGILGGAWTPSDWTGDIHKYCYGMYNVLKDKYGVKFFFNAKIYNVREDLGYFDKIVIANGVGATKLTSKLSDKRLVYPVKGYSITVTVDDIDSLPTVSLLDDQAKIVTATLGNRFRVAGTAELAGHNYDIRRDRIEPLLKWVHNNFPMIDARNYSQWACLRPMAPNMMPIVEESYVKDIYYHFGHGHLGWTLSPATAQQLVRIMEK